MEGMNFHTNPREPARLLTIAEVSERLGLGRTKTFELLKRGELRSVRIGGARRIPSSEVEGFIERLLVNDPQVNASIARTASRQEPWAV